MDLKTILKSKLTTLALALVLVLVMLGTAQVLLRKYEVERQIAGLQKKADEINQKNIKLAELVKYLNTPEYKEREVRERLNLKKEGEFVVALPNQFDESVAGEQIEKTPTNPEKWFNYLFP
jgi:cell division protein FtsB